MWSALVMAALLALGGCDGGSADPVPDPTEAELVFRFQDASVPPEYHRSYTLRLTGAADGAQGEVVVDSYGDELDRVPVDVSTATWQRALDELDAVDAITATAPGCAGGTAREVEVVAGGETLTAASVEACGDDGQVVAEQLDDAIAPLLAGVDMEGLLRTG